MLTTAVAATLQTIVSSIPTFGQQRHSHTGGAELTFVAVEGLSLRLLLSRAFEARIQNSASLPAFAAETSVVRWPDRNRHVGTRFHNCGRRCNSRSTTGYRLPCIKAISFPSLATIGLGDCRRVIVYVRVVDVLGEPLSSTRHGNRASNLRRGGGASSSGTGRRRTIQHCHWRSHRRNT